MLKHVVSYLWLACEFLPVSALGDNKTIVQRWPTVYNKYGVATADRRKESVGEFEVAIRLTHPQSEESDVKQSENGNVERCP